MQYTDKETQKLSHFDQTQPIPVISFKITSYKNYFFNCRENEMPKTEENVLKVIQKQCLTFSINIKYMDIATEIPNFRFLIWVHNAHHTLLNQTFKIGP